MKGLRTLSWVIALALAVALAADLASGLPLGPGFTYQGQLILNGNPVNGPTHLRFRLFDVSAGGSPIGGSHILPNVPVANGLFTVLLNDNNEFGPTAFNGDARWLEISVCSDPGCTSSTILTPRQAITATPYALHAAGPWQSAGGSLTYMNGNVGIGIANPHTKLELQSGFGTEVLRFGLSNSDYHFISTGFHGAQSHLNFLGFNLEHGSNDIRRVMTLQGDGKLLVNGNIALGANAEYSATAGQEDLRLLRGAVSAQGSILQGSGYSVFRISAGVYQISFNPPFTNIPSVTATPFNHGLENRLCGVIQQGVSLVTIVVHNGSASEVDWGFNFCAIGPR